MSHQADPALADLRERIIGAAHARQRAADYADDHPEDPNGDASVEYHDDQLDELIDVYYNHRKALESAKADES